MPSDHHANNLACLPARFPHLRDVFPDDDDDDLVRL
jgi:hypothetical protein